MISTGLIRDEFSSLKPISLFLYCLFATSYRERASERERTGIDYAQFASQEDNGKKKRNERKARIDGIQGKKAGERRRAPGRTGYRICFFFPLFFFFASWPLLSSPPRTRILIFRNSSRDGRTSARSAPAIRAAWRGEEKEGSGREEAARKPPTAVASAALSPYQTTSWRLQLLPFLRDTLRDSLVPT